MTSIHAELYRYFLVLAFICFLAEVFASEDEPVAYVISGSSMEAVNGW